ncbi:hypothetical protein AAE478_002037 [Parahypoxylon ruwenzoriense]
MSKKSTFTTISPLPPGVTRQVVIDFLHNHVEMIDLNPLVIERHPITAPPHAPPEEHECVWWSMTDKIFYLPGGVVAGDITYTAAFNDLPNGIQTHCYAPMGTDIRERWSLNGTLPGEPPEPVELGIGAPRQGLYLREDVELRCNFVMSSFVKKTLKKAHSTLVERLLQKSKAVSAGAGSGTGSPVQGTGTYQHQYRAVSSPDGPSVHNGRIHSGHSSSLATYPTSVSSQYTSPPGSSAPYSHQSNRNTGSNSFVPEPLRVNKARSSSGQQHHQGPGEGPLIIIIAINRAAAAGRMRRPSMAATLTTRTRRLGSKGRGALLRSWSDEATVPADIEC